MSNIDRFMHWPICAFSIATGIGSLWLGLAPPSHAKAPSQRPVAEAVRSSTFMGLPPQD